MRRYGLLDSEARKALVRLQERHRAMAKVVPLFADNKQRQMASINRFSEEIFEMAEKAKAAIAREKSAPKEFVWKGFVDVKLSDTDKANYATWDIADDDVWDGIATYCEAGVKIAITYNKQNASFNCAGTGQQGAGENHGYCVVAHAKSPYEAARVWLYKVSALLGDIWSEYKSGKADDIG